MSTASLPWVKKYQPKNTKEIQGQDKAIEQLMYFVKNYKGSKKKAVILYGQSGNGKTSSVHALANELNYELIEINASDARNADQIQATVGTSSTQMSLFSQSKIILVDEIDGLSGSKDRGGIAALTKLLDKSAFPIVITANNPFDKKLSTLRKKCEMIEFTTLNYLSIAKILKKICDAEGIQTSEDTIKALARRAGGDLRGAITDLQLLTKNNTLDPKSLEELSGRRQTESMLKALVKVFKTTDPSVALSAYDAVDEDFDKIMLWIDENLPLEYQQPKDLARAYDYLSRSDVFFGRIRRWQHWRFLAYINQFLSAGIAVSKEEKYKHFFTYKPTSRILKLWMAKQKNAKRKAIAQKIAQRTHSSATQIIKQFDYYKIMFASKQLGDALAEEFELDSDEVAYLQKK